MYVQLKRLVSILAFSRLSIKVSCSNRYRLKPQAEKIIAEEQTGFKVGKSNTEQIFNLRILSDRYMQRQQDPYHVFIDFKMAFNRVWHAALWTTMKKYNTIVNRIRVIKHHYDKAISAALFNIFLERIMTDALEDHEDTVSIGGRTITNLRPAADIDGLAGDEN